MKLNLGCGDRKIHGFINVDIRKKVNPDVVDDIFMLNKFNINSAYLIYACHCLEHLTAKKTQKALNRWYEILQKNGVLRISVPDIEKVMEHYLINKNLKILHGFIWGGHKNKYDLHYQGFDKKTLTELLTSIGFKKIKEYDWKKTEHYYVDDYSQAYLPHLDKINGKIMSLNIEATK